MGYTESPGKDPESILETSGIHTFGYILGLEGDDKRVTFRELDKNIPYDSRVVRSDLENLRKEGYLSLTEERDQTYIEIEEDGGIPEIMEETLLDACDELKPSEKRVYMELTDEGRKYAEDVRELEHLAQTLENLLGV